MGIFPVELLHERKASMKFKWSELKAVAMEAFALFAKDKAMTFDAVENVIYHKSYRTSLQKREAAGLAGEKFKRLNSKWDEKARACAAPIKPILPELKTPAQRISVRRNVLKRQGGPDDESGSDDDMGDDWAPSHEELKSIVRLPEPPHPFRMKLQFEQFGKTVAEDVAPATTEIEAIVCTISNAPARSRLTLIVHPQCTGHRLFRKLHALAVVLNHVGSSSSGAICDFKVMSPKLGSEGPESAVIYLTEPLQSGNVELLVMELLSLLGEDLMDLGCPFGLAKLEKGIYGADIPGSTIEVDVVGHPCHSSAGRLIAAVITRATWQAANDLHHGPDVAKNREQILGKNTTQGKEVPWAQKQKEIEEEHVRRCLSDVLGELKWQLEY
jgi:hypothetical protein